VSARRGGAVTPAPPDTVVSLPPGDTGAATDVGVAAVVEGVGETVAVVVGAGAAASGVVVEGLGGPAAAVSSPTSRSPGRITANVAPAANTMTIAAASGRRAFTTPSMPTMAPM